MDPNLILRATDRLEVAVDSGAHLDRERLLLAVLALLPPDGAWEASRRSLAYALTAADCSMSERDAAFTLLKSLSLSSRKEQATEVQREWSKLSLGRAAGPHLLDALEHLVRARRAIKDSVKQVSSLWLCLHECVGAVVEADDAWRNPVEWGSEHDERVIASDADAVENSARKIQHLHSSAQRRLADRERWEVTRRAWLHVIEQLRDCATVASPPPSG